MRAIPLFSLLLCVLAFAFPACGDAGTNEPIDREPVDRSTYPPGPYGTTVDSVIQNFSFVERLADAEGTAFSLQDLRNVGGERVPRVLYINTAAGWCSACREEQPALNQLMADYESRGLRILVALFEDDDFQPANDGTVERWKTRYNTTFTVIPDPSQTFRAFYDPTLTPLNLVIDLDSMLIAYRSTGTDIQNLRRQFDALLR